MSVEGIGPVGYQKPIADRRATKLSLSILLATPAITGVLMTRSGEMWPILPIGFAIYALTFLLSVSLLNENLSLITGVGILGGVILRAQMVLVSAAFVGRDLPWYMRDVQRVVNSGSTDVIIKQFYNTFPAFHVYLTELYLLLGSPRMAVLGAASIIGVVLPLGAGYFAYVIIQDQRAFALTAALAATSHIAVRFSVIPIAQSLHVMTVGIGAGLLIGYLRSNDRRYGLSLLLVLLLWTASHKLPLFFFGATCIGLLVLDGGYRLLRTQPQASVRYGMVLALTAGLLFAIQSVFLTAYLPLSLAALVVAPEGLTMTAAATGSGPALPLLSTIFTTLASGRLIVGLAALSMGYLLLTHHASARHRLSIGIVGGAIVACFVALAGWAQLNRLFGSLFPLLFAMIGVGYVAVQQSIPSGRKIAAVLLVVLAISQAGSAGLAFDDPRRPQLYVDGQDMGAKDWAATYATEPVMADTQFALAIRPNNLPKVTERVGSATSISGNGVLQRPYSEQDMRSHPVARRDIDQFFYPPVFRLYSDTASDSNDRNLVYNSGSTTISQGPRRAPGSIE